MSASPVATKFAVPLIAAVGAALIVLALQPPARATVAEPATPVTGNATYFDGLGAPYGGCGMPQAELETQNFVALNVFDTPGDATAYPRPVPAAQAARMGLWNNGHNCGRWVRVRIGDYCNGVNDGALGQPFCRNGSWTADAYNDGTLDMLVADSCADTNGWCRDDPYHLDLSKDSLNRFVKNGTAVGDLYPAHWNNRHISWSFIPAPSYTGDIRIGFLSGAQRWWPAISVSHLPNGIHGIEYFADGAWRAATMNNDMGQSYIIGGTTSGGTDFRIRIRDAADALLAGGRIYSFTLPSTCTVQCGQPYTAVGYATSSSSTPSSPAVSASASASVSASPSGGGAGCAASVTVTSTWTGGYQATVDVRNTGGTASAGWTVRLVLAGSQHVANSWNAVVTQSGQQLTATNQSYNAVVPPGGSTSWGMVVDGVSQPVTGLVCTLR